TFSGHDGHFSRRRIHLGGECELSWRHGAFVNLGRSHRRNGGSETHHDVHHASWFALESAGNQALLGVHDGRHARGDRHAQIRLVAPFRTHERQGNGKERSAA